MLIGILLFGVLAHASASSELELETYHAAPKNTTKWVHKISEYRSEQSTPFTLHTTNHRHETQESTATEVTEKLNKALHKIHNQKKLNKSNKHSKLYKGNKRNADKKQNQNKTRRVTKKQTTTANKRKRNVKQTRKSGKEHKTKNGNAKRKMNNSRKLNPAKFTNTPKIEEHFDHMKYTPVMKKPIEKKRVVRQPDDGLYIAKNLDDTKFISSENDAEYDTVNVNVKNYWKK